MCFKNAKNILPPELLNELQRYIQGEMLYVPLASKSKAGWGELSGARAEIKKRNAEIRRRFRDGADVRGLARQYYLSEPSVRKIVSKTYGEYI